MDEAIEYCNKGLGIWNWASNDEGNPDVVIACAGDIPTMEALACVDMLRLYVPELKLRFINVIDLMVLQPGNEHPHGLTDEAFEALFTRDKPIIFAFHGYPSLIHKLVYKRHNHDNFHVRGYKEEGTTTTPFDMVVLNELDRFHLFLDVLERVSSPKLPQMKQMIEEKLQKHKAYIEEFGDDLPEIKDWKWSYGNK